jgi:enediyne biosynthesis protein E4
MEPAERALPPFQEPARQVLNGNAIAWLLVRLIGNVSNRSAVGAKVRARATTGGKEFWQLREISGGSGYYSQNGLRAHFGLGDAAQVDTLRIEWPSGIVQVLKDVTPNQRGMKSDG